MEITLMTRRSLKLVGVAGFVCVLAEVAVAGVLPSPFGFSFFPPGLTDLFLLPFSLAGCG